MGGYRAGGLSWAIGEDRAGQEGKEGSDGKDEVQRHEHAVFALDRSFAPHFSGEDAPHAFGELRLDAWRAVLHCKP